MGKGYLMGSKLTSKDEAYLSLLCLKNSTERIAKLYTTYIQIRSITGSPPPMLMAMLHILCSKREGIQRKLAGSWPDYMQNKKWHAYEEQSAKIRDLTDETQQKLEQIFNTEILMLELVYIMGKSD